MKREGDRIILSAWDLMRIQGCPHATTLDLAWLDRRGGQFSGIAPKPNDESAKLLQAKGDTHERAFDHTPSRPHSRASRQGKDHPS